MKTSARELWWALAAVVAITAVYLVAVNLLLGVPAASSLFGHGIGIAGFMLMLATETLYSLRKRSRRARWGRTASWLRFHIFTGLVGPYMVLLHTSWQFNGLAGLVTLLTLVVVASGFTGRYIYTAVPRTADGLIVEAHELQAQIAGAEGELRRALASLPSAAQALVLQPAAPLNPPEGAWRLVLARPFREWSARRHWRRALRQVDVPAREQARRLDELAARRRLLHHQAASLTAARQLLGVWHSVHIPIGMALFTAAFIHIAAALYFATLLR